MPDNTKIKVHITSCVTSENDTHSEKAILVDLFNRSDKKYSLENDPISADIIILVDASFEHMGEPILNNALVKRFPRKCFIHCHADSPLYVLHGLYASNNKNAVLARGRSRTASYNLMNRSFTNPYINNFDPEKALKVDKKYLFSFIGRNSWYIRDILFNMKFNRPDIKIENSDGFQFWKNVEGNGERQEYFYRTLLESKFSLCIRGTGTNSIRLFESIRLGISPVIISDGWALPRGPNWNDFSIFIKEKQVNEIEHIISSYENNYKEMGALSRKCFERFFSDESYFNYIVDNLINIQKNQLFPEFLYLFSMPLYLKFVQERSKIRKVIKRVNH